MNLQFGGYGNRLRWPTDSDQINFTKNGLPSQPVIRIDPDPAGTNDALTAVMDTLYDPEGSGSVHLRMAVGGPFNLRTLPTPFPHLQPSKMSNGRYA